MQSSAFYINFFGIVIQFEVSISINLHVKKNILFARTLAIKFYFSIKKFKCFIKKLELKQAKIYEKTKTSERIRNGIRI